MMSIRSTYGTALRTKKPRPKADPGAESETSTRSLYKGVTGPRVSTTETSRTTICSIHEWTCSHTTSKIRNKCQIIYFFFVGANLDPNALTENLLLGNSATSIDYDFTSLLLTREQEHDAIQNLRRTDQGDHDASNSNSTTTARPTSRSAAR